MKGEFIAVMEEGKRTVRPGSYLALADGIRACADDAPRRERKLEQVSLALPDPGPMAAAAAGPLSFARGEAFRPARWHQKLADLASMMWNDTDLGRSWGPTLVRELIAERLASESNLAPMERDGDPRIGRVLERMKEELASPILSIDALATSVGLTGTQMRKLFYRETRTRPKEHLHRLRMERAVQLLRHSTQTIEQIAAACGFATDNYFHLVFQKAFMVTPTEFRSKQVV